jgi:cysteine desulfurase family protein (TIGR01976 family)
VSAAFDVEIVRAQFPALALEIAGRPAAFLDGPGGTQVPHAVLDAVRAHLVHANANTHGTFLTSERSDATITAARAAAADLVGCDAAEIVFGPNMTTLTFALARALGRDLGAGDEVVVTTLDHDANVAPWRALEERGVTVRTLDIRPDDCTLDLEALDAALSSRTRLVAVGWASNAVGTINPVGRIVARARAAGALTFVDAVHFAPHHRIDVVALGCDFLACSVYKFFGPHIGALFARREHLERLRPYKVRPAADHGPERWETGTQNHEGLAGTVAAVEYLAGLGARLAPAAVGRRARLDAAFAGIAAHELGLAARFLDGVRALPGVRLYGIADPARLGERTATFAVRLATCAPGAASARLGAAGVFTWAGNYYALGLTERLGVEAAGGMLRIGFVHYNTVDEVDRVVEALSRLAV